MLRLAGVIALTSCLVADMYGLCPVADFFFFFLSLIVLFSLFENELPPFLSLMGCKTNRCLHEAWLEYKMPAKVLSNLMPSFEGRS